MKKLIAIISIFSLLTCSRDDLSGYLGGEDLAGSINLSVVLNQSFAGGTGAESPWNHTFQGSATITFTSTTSVFSRSVTFNPNDLANFPATSLPYDTYTWSIADAGAEIAVSSGLYVYGNSASAFTVADPTLTLALILDTDFALVTVSETDVSNAGISQNGLNTALTVQDGYYYGYINSNFANYTLSIVTPDNLSGSDTINNPIAYIHYNYNVIAETLGEVGISLALSNAFTLEDRDIFAVGDDDLDGVPNAQDFCPGTRSGAPVDANGCLDVIELDANGVTLKAKPGAAAGDQQELNGVLYTVVDETTLRTMVANDEDVTTVVTTLVTDMGYLLFDKRTFNQDISTWDVSNVINLAYNFYVNAVFNQDISFWDVGNVTNMRGLFQLATAFNQDLSNWNTSQVTDLFATFGGTQFNLNIDNWDTSNVTNMEQTFSECKAPGITLAGWDVSQVTNMALMFNGAINFNGEIEDWDVSQVTNMREMFHDSNFNKDISNWNVSQVEHMFAMFGASPFNVDISNWDVGNVTNFSQMFYGTPFNQDISSWDVSSAVTLASMFDSSVFNVDISNWDVSNVTDMSWMFNNTQYNQDLGGWNVSNVTICGNFASGNSTWILPKPNFTNCSP